MSNGRCSVVIQSAHDLSICPAMSMPFGIGLRRARCCSKRCPPPAAQKILKPKVLIFVCSSICLRSQLFVRSTKHTQLPVADDMGRCNEANSVEFDVSVPAFRESENACAREVENLEDECSLAFGWERFSGELYAGTSGTVSPETTFDGDNYVQVNGGPA